MENLKKENKGITLISLLITIIVLVILAMVSINLVTGEESIIAHANNAATKYKTEAENENAKIQELLAKMPDTNGNNTPEDVDDDNEIPDELWQYIMVGEDDGTEGVYIDEIMDEHAVFFIANSIMPDPKIEYIKDYDYENGLHSFVKYKGTYYKTIINQDGKFIHLEKLYTPSQSENIGKVVQYGKYKYVIISDDNGKIEMVSQDSLGSLRLGYNEGTTDKSQQTTEAINSYNNAITILNNYCKEVTEIEDNSINVRSIGNSGKEDTSGYNNNVKESDCYIDEDLVKLYDANAFEVSNDYWFASRTLYADAKIKIWNEVDQVIDREILYSEKGEGHYGVLAVRPVITLNTSVLQNVSGAGTTESPYVIQ